MGRSALVAMVPKMKPGELPRKPLKLLPGLRWTGKLRILQRLGASYTVAFDAEGTDSGEKYFIYDHTVLTANELKKWTGWSE